MFTISPRDRYLYAGPVGLEVAAMTYGRLQYQAEPSKLAAKRSPVMPWSRSATMPAESLPLVREVTRKPARRSTPAIPERFAAMMRARDARLSELKERSA